MTLLSTSYTPASSALRKKASVWLARLHRAVNNWLAAMLAYRARQAALHALRGYSDHQLKDMGLYRGELYHAIDEASRRQSRGEI